MSHISNGLISLVQVCIAPRKHFRYLPITKDVTSLLTTFVLGTNYVDDGPLSLYT